MFNIKREFLGLLPPEAHLPEPYEASIPKPISYNYPWTVFSIAVSVTLPAITLCRGSLAQSSKYCSNPEQK